MAKRRNDSKPASGRATGQAKSRKAKKTAKVAPRRKTKKAVDLEESPKYRKKTVVVGRGKKGASKKVTVKRIAKIRSLAARKGWETRRENARIAEEKRARRSEAAKASWARRKRDVQLVERRKLLDIRDLRQIADDRIAKLEAKEKAAHKKNFKELFAVRVRELEKMTRRQLMASLPDDIQLTVDPKADKQKVFEYVKMFEGLRVKSFLVGMEHTSEMAGDAMKRFVQTKVYGTELEFLQSLDTTRQILMYTQNWEEAPDSVLFSKLKVAYGTPQFEAIVEVLANETGHSQRYLYSLFHSPDASVFT